MPDADVQRVLDYCKHLKELRVADLDAPAMDVFPTVAFWRAGRQVAMVQAMDVDRDLMLSAARYGVPGFGADVVVAVHEAYRETKKSLLERGQRALRPGELQELFNKGRTDLVQEALLMAWATRIGEKYIKQAGYTLDRATRTLTWVDDDDPVNQVHAGAIGLIPKSLARSFDAPDLMTMTSDIVHPEDVGLTEQEARWHADMAVCRILCGLGFLVHMSAETEDAAAIMQRSAEDTPGMSFYASDGKSERKHGPFFEQQD